MMKETKFWCCKCRGCGRVMPVQFMRTGGSCACQTSSGMIMIAEWDTVKQEGFSEGTWWERMKTRYYYWQWKRWAKRRNAEAEKGGAA